MPPISPLIPLWCQQSSRIHEMITPPLCSLCWNVMEADSISGAGVLLQNSVLVQYQAWGNRLSSKRWEAKKKKRTTASHFSGQEHWLESVLPKEQLPPQAQGMENQQQDGPLEAEIEGQDSPFLSVFSSAFHVHGSCCREYLVVSTNLYMWVLADHPVCGQQLQKEDRSISP